MGQIYVERDSEGDYNKPMGVATYKTISGMSKDMQQALPDIEELKRLMNDENEEIVS